MRLPEGPSRRQALGGASPYQPGDQSIERLVGNRPHFLVGPILNRMLDEDGVRMESECGALTVGRVDKDIAGHKDGGYTATLKIGAVVHTARRATTSIG